MFRPLRTLFLFFFLSAALCPFAAYAQRPPDMEKIRKREVTVIRFEGDSNITPLELESIIATRTSGWFERSLNSVNSDWGTPQQFVDETVLAEDTLRIFIYYRSRGYFDARVGFSLHESKPSVDAWQIVNDRNKFLPPSNWEKYPIIEDTVVFSVTEGKPYTVAGFTFEGLEHLPMDLQNQVTEKIGIKLNSRYLKDNLDLEILRVREILGENGYPFLSLPNGATIIDIDKTKKSVTISLMFKTGPRVRVGATRIINDTAYSKYGHVRDHVILRQMSLDSGAWFRNSDRLASERDIGRLGTFQYINIELDSSAFAKLPDSAKNGLALPVLTYLRMRPSWEITPGPYAGISAFNQFILGLGASYSNRNIFGGAENLTLQASYQFLPSNQKRATLGGDLVFPYFLFKNVPLTLSPNYTYSDQRSVNSGKLQFLERITSANAGLNFQLSNDPSPIIPLTLKGSLQYVNRDYRDSSIFNGHIDNTTVPTQFNIIGSIDLSFNWTNDPQNPSHGSFIGFSLQRTLPIPVANLPSAAYTKLTPQFKTFFNLSSTDGRSVLGYRILYGNVWLDHPDDQSRDILIENRYFGGGTNSLRGWPARTLLVSNNSTPGHPQFGGYKTVETNLEWRYAPFHYPVEITAAQQFFSALRIAFFCDAGNVWDKDVPIAVKNFAIAVGTGIRYNTLVGAIRFDFGFKLYDPFPDAYPPGTKGVDKPNKDILLAMPPNSSTGVWLFNRKGWKLGDILNIEFALGQAF